MQGGYLLLANSGGTGPNPIKPEKRSPLVFPRCGSCPSPFSYDKTLPAPIPDDPRYLITNAWGIPIAGLPFIPGVGSREHPERFISYLFPYYPTWAQEQWFDELDKRGYRTVVFSWPDARNAGQSIADFRTDCYRAKQRGFRVHVKIWSKNFDPHDMRFDQFKAFVDPIFDALNGVVDEYGFWEYDLGNLSTDDAISIHRYCGQRAHNQSAAFFCHFSAGKGSWWEGHTQQQWYQTLGPDVDGLDLQTDPASDIGDTQARIVDHLARTTPSGHLVRAFEPGIPSLMFSNDHPTEDEGDAFCFLAVCTRGAGIVYGSAAGLRLPNGDPPLPGSTA